MHNQSPKLNDESQVILGWGQLCSGVMLLIAAYIASKDIVSIFLVDFSVLNQVLIALLFATCGALLVKLAAERLTRCNRSLVFKLAIISFLLPLPSIFFPITIFVAGFADFFAWLLIVLTVIILFLNSSVDDLNWNNQIRKSPRLLAKSLFLLVPFSSSAMWILIPRALTAVSQRHVDKATLDLVTYMVSSIGFLSGVLITIWITFKPRKFTHQIKAFLALLILPTIWGCIYLWN